MTGTAVPGRVCNLEQAMRLHGQRAGQYVAAMGRTDPLADAVVADLASLPKGSGLPLVERALRDGIDGVPDAPDSLVVLFEQLDRRPFWVDLEQIDRGAAACMRHAKAAGMALGAASLVASYANEAATRPLALTRRFIDKADLRMYETGMWWQATISPGGLHRDGAGFARTVRVRLIHAFVRRALLSGGEWDSSRWGAPINQADMSYTVVTFSLIPLRAMHRLGVRYSGADLAAIYQLWRYMGYLMGVEEALLPAGQDESERMEHLYQLLSPPPDDYCRELVNSLIDGPLARQLQAAAPPLRLLMRRHGRSIVHGLSRDFIGDSIADSLGLSDTLLKHLPALVGPPAAVVNRMRNLSTSGRRRRLARNLALTHTRLAATARRLSISHDLVDPA